MLGEEREKSGISCVRENVNRVESGERGIFGETFSTFFHAIQIWSAKQHEPWLEESGYPVF